jgi:NitT/TauT family transport system ATP-binding protein
VPDRAVAVRGLSHRFAADAGEVLALDDVALDVAAGEFVSIVGPSGCGKTTLLRAVAGLVEPSEGRLEVLDVSPREARSGHALGIVTQEPGLLPWRTVEANVALALEVTGRSGDVGALLSRVGIAPFAGYHPKELSGGMRQRVALARALAHGPRLLLMDEPFGALDELSRESMRLELLRIWERERISVLFVTHSIREAVLLSDRVVVMSPSPGHVVADVPIDLPRPRFEAQEAEPAFASAVAEVRQALRLPQLALRAEAGG